MNSIKTLATVAILAAVGIGLYLKINSTPPSEPPEEALGTWDAPPPIEMGALDDQMSGITAEAPPLGGSEFSGGMAPSYDASGAGGMAPAYGAGNTAPAFGAAPPYNAGGTAPAFDPSAAGGTAPAFNSGGAAPAFDPSAMNNAPAEQSLDLSPGRPVNADPFVQPASGASPAGLEQASFDRAWEQAQKLLQQNQLDAAHKALSRWYGDASLNARSRDQLVELLSQLAGTLIYSTEHHLEPAFTVQAGETLPDIAGRFNVSPQLLAKINGIADVNQPLEAGTQLKVVRGPFTAFVNLSQRELTLALDGRYAGRFPIGIGQEWQPVEGEFEVQTKYTNPTYYGRNQTIDADDPSNPLGEHWVGLVSKDGSYSGPLGIHGTMASSSVHHDDARGYLRLSPQDAEDVFDILTVGSKVIISR